MVSTTSRTVRRSSVDPAAAFPDSGQVIGAQGEGYCSKVDGEQQRRIRGINSTSADTVVLADAVLDLATRSYRGTLAERT